MSEKEILSKGENLATLEKREADVWRKMEGLIQRHAMKTAQRPAVDGPLRLLDAVEEFRASAREIAEGVRELTAIIREQVLLSRRGLTVEEVAAKVDALLAERIAWHFREHQMPGVSGDTSAK